MTVHEFFSQAQREKCLKETRLIIRTETKDHEVAAIHFDTAITPQSGGNLIIDLGQEIK